MNQPLSFLPREVISNYKPVLNASLHYAMDYDLWLRITLNHKVHVVNGHWLIIVFTIQVNPGWDLLIFSLNGTRLASAIGEGKAPFVGGSIGGVTISITLSLELLEVLFQK